MSVLFAYFLTALYGVTLVCLLFLRYLWIPHGEDCNVYRLLGYDAVHSGKNLPIFRMNVLYKSSKLKMEAVLFSRTSVNAYQTTRR